MPVPDYADHQDQQQIVNPRTSKIERVFVNLAAVYPSHGERYGEMSFEELRATARGWLNRDWAAESKQRSSSADQLTVAQRPDGLIALEQEYGINDTSEMPNQQDVYSSPSSQLETTIAVDINKEGKVGRPKKMRIKEIKGETQTSRTSKET